MFGPIIKLSPCPIVNDVRFGLSPKHLLLILLIESERVTLVKSHPKNASSPISTTLVGMVKLGA